MWSECVGTSTQEVCAQTWVKRTDIYYVEQRAKSYHSCGYENGYLGNMCKAGNCPGSICRDLCTDNSLCLFYFRGGGSCHMWNECEGASTHEGEAKTWRKKYTKPDSKAYAPLPDIAGFGYDIYREHSFKTCGLDTGFLGDQCTAGDCPAKECRDICTDTPGCLFYFRALDDHWGACLLWSECKGVSIMEKPAKTWKKRTDIYYEPLPRGNSVNACGYDNGFIRDMCPDHNCPGRICRDLCTATPMCIFYWRGDGQCLMWSECVGISKQETPAKTWQKKFKLPQAHAHGATEMFTPIEIPTPAPTPACVDVTRGKACKDRSDCYWHGKSKTCMDFACEAATSRKICMKIFVKMGLQCRMRKDACITYDPAVCLSLTTKECKESPTCEFNKTARECVDIGYIPCEDFTNRRDCNKAKPISHPPGCKYNMQTMKCEDIPCSTKTKLGTCHKVGCFWDGSTCSEPVNGFIL